jgi:hypothetical protein
VPASARRRSRCSGAGSTYRATKSTPSSVSTSRTADEYGHHSTWYSVSGILVDDKVELAGEDAIETARAPVAHRIADKR